MCFVWDFWLNFLDSSNFLALYATNISEIALSVSILSSYVWVFIKQMKCRGLYVHLTSVYVQICPTMSDNEPQ